MMLVIIFEQIFLKSKSKFFETIGEYLYVYADYFQINGEEVLGYN